MRWRTLLVDARTPGAHRRHWREVIDEFAIVKDSAQSLDIGLKLKSKSDADRVEPAGSWNSMVTHRVRVDDADEIDKQCSREGSGQGSVCSDGSASTFS